MGAPVAAGDIVGGRYRVERVLGTGAMGVVVAATHIRLGHAVAIKFMLPGAIGNEQSVARFLREARAAANLRMEYLEGNDLAHVLQTQGPISVRAAATYVIQACDALAEAHAAGIIHRDIKPANLFLTTRRDGSPLIKVLDFGISKANQLTETGLVGTNTQALLGSPLYMSPEQMNSPRQVDGRSDIWSLGITLYQLTTGRPPFSAETLPALFVQIVQGAPHPMREVRPDVPDAFAQTVMRCLEKDPQRRFASVDELARALAALTSLERATPAPFPVPILASTQPRQAQPGGQSVQPAATGPVVQTAANWGNTNGEQTKPRRALLFVSLALLGTAVAASTVYVLAAMWSSNNPQGAAASSNAAEREAQASHPTASASPSVVAPPVLPSASASAVVVPGPQAATAPADAGAPAPQVTGTAKRPAPLPPSPPPTPKPASAPSTTASDCVPPYVFDATGKKIWKAQCL
jgi:serine/threonine protein kinase